MSRKVIDTFKNESGDIITKLEDVNGTILVESFMDSEESLGYTSYVPDDGGGIKVKTEGLDLDGDSITVKHEDVIRDMLCTSFDVDCEKSEE